LSSEVEFFDFLYLGVFVILSPAYDDRFYRGLNPPPRVVNEVESAVWQFHALLHIFYRRFKVVLEGVIVSPSYVVDRMLGEFAAASVVFANAVYESEGLDGDDDVEDRIPRSAFVGRIESILLASHPEVFPYYLRCLDCGHKDFSWTGPDVKIRPCSKGIASCTSLSTKGDFMDLPSHQIYTEDVDVDLSIAPDPVIHVGKRRIRGDSLNLGGDQAKKRNRRS
jgi:hypothetical protein